MDYSEWKELNEKFLSSKLTISEFCRENKINRNNFYMWKKKFKKDEEVQKKDVKKILPLKKKIVIKPIYPPKDISKEEAFYKAATKEDLKHIVPEFEEVYPTPKPKESVPPIYPIHSIIRITLPNGANLEIENNCNIEQLKTIIETLGTLK